MDNFYEVLVSNIGKVWEGTIANDGIGVFNQYVKFSTNNNGRAGGEDVTFWVDGEIIDEFEGSIRASMDC